MSRESVGIHLPESCSDLCRGASCECGHTKPGPLFSHVLIRILSAVLLLAFALYNDYTGGMSAVTAITAGLSLLLTGVPVIVEAITGLIQGKRNVCELAALALAGAVVIGEWVTAAEIALIMCIGEHTEEYMYSRAGRDLEGIITRHPRFCHLLRDTGTIEIPVDDLTAGDRLMIRPGDIVPVDCRIHEGRSGLDESCLTGESIPVFKGPGDTIWSGSTNLDGVLIVDTLRPVSESTYARIIELVSEAGERRPPSHPFIDRCARWYSPLMLLIAGLVLLGTGDAVRAITVLIVACPCALLLSTPSAVVAALGAAARRGILVKKGEFLEICRSITTIVFDKTGTLTSGVMKVIAIEPSGGTPEHEMLRIAGTAEISSSHPAGKAIVQACRDVGIELQIRGTACQYPGEGVEDRSDAGVTLVGSLSFLERKGVKIPLPESDVVSNPAVCTVFVSHNGQYSGCIRIADQVRSETQKVLADLVHLGLSRIIILTGDTHQAAISLARFYCLPENRVFSGLRPSEKEAYIAELQEAGEKVCFIGDGTNDGPALARAELGISIAGRHDTVALETAGVILMRDGLSLLADYICLGRRTSQIIIQNVILALALNLLLILAAAAGLLSPAAGAVGHQVATVLVLLNSLRLAGVRPRSGGHRLRETCGLPSHS